MSRLLLVAVTALGLASMSRRAEAYPQFQLAKDQTCSGCHISPAGGGVLNENGLNTAQAISKFGQAAEFFYNKITAPDWLDLGGEVRAAAGYFQTPFKSLAGFPMQIEADVSPHYKGFRLYATVGFRPTQSGNAAATAVWSREHYLMWQQDEGSQFGLSIRAGRFMPVFGLRLAEHPDYIRRYGGTALYTETYGAAVEYIAKDLEVHLTGFIADPLIDTVDTARGGAFYGEYRVSEHVSVGVEGMIQKTDDDKRTRGGVTGKVLAPGGVLLEAELQYVSQIIEPAGAPKQLVGYLLASREMGQGFQLDIGLGHYDENIRVKDLDRDCVDVNLHWYATSHVELIWNNRLEVFALGNGGPTGAYSLVQLHYRL